MLGKVPRILIVDDVRTNLILLRNILEKEGFEVYEAADGVSARLEAVEKQPDLILLDVMMPGESGFSTCRRLKEDPRTSEIPVIFITALMEIDNKIKGFDAGAVDYITKPYEKMDVLIRSKLHLRLSAAMKSVVENQSRGLMSLREAQNEILINPEELPEAGFSVYYRPVNDAGGDFYDVLSFGNNIFGYFCADVSGHELGSSLATSAFKALIHQNSGLLFTPAETMTMVNRVLRTVLSDEKYLTAVYVLMNRNSGILKVVSAGHPPVIIARKGESPQVVSLTGDVLGMFDAVSFDSAEYSLKQGDRLFLYSDGLIESSDGGGTSRKKGIEKLSSEIDRTSGLPLSEAVNSIVSGIFGESEISDDLLLLGVTV